MHTYNMDYAIGTENNKQQEGSHDDSKEAEEIPVKARRKWMISQG